MPTSNRTITRSTRRYIEAWERLQRRLKRLGRKRKKGRRPLGESCSGISTKMAARTHRAETTAPEYVAKNCIAMMRARLHRNMCGVIESGLLRTSIAESIGHFKLDLK